MLTDDELVDEDGTHELAGAALLLARRFEAEAILWCVAPGWPEHARHLAVEFVHPVIMGKPALRAISLNDPDLTSVLRAQVRPGDVIVGVGPPSAAMVDVFARTSAWGAAGLWIGAGPRPRHPTVDHLLWIGDDVVDAFHDGRIVLLYHLLWELTHVCLEYGVEPETVSVDASDHCITCSDEATVAEVVGVTGDGLASMRVAGRIDTVDASLIDELSPDDLVLVHAGTAIARIEAEQAGE